MSNLLFQMKQLSTRLRTKVNSSINTCCGRQVLTQYYFPPRALLAYSLLVINDKYKLVGLINQVKNYYWEVLPLTMAHYFMTPPGGHRQP